MKHQPGRLQSLAVSRAKPGSYRCDASLLADDLERLEMLLPEIPRTPTPARDLQAYALAYIERYAGDILQMEHEWAFLYAALRDAWFRTEHRVVLQLVSSLVPLMGRLSNPAVAEHMMSMGIEAGRRVEDHERLAYFLSLFGGLLFSAGKYREGRRTWAEGMELARSLDSAPGLWEPFSTFAYTADILGDYQAAEHFASPFLHARHTDQKPEALAVAVFVRGFYARQAGDPDRAYDDFSFCLHILFDTYPSNGTPPTPARQLFTAAVQAELARVQGDYDRAQAYAATSLNLAHTYGDRFTLVDLLFDQALYTHRHEQFADTRMVVDRLREISDRSKDRALGLRCRLLEQQLSVSSPQSYSAYFTRSRPSHACRQPLDALSEREIEVLQLVAEGLDNRQIAGRLVVTPATVRKHLEHVYGKLDVHSRTSAVAVARVLKIVA